MKTYAELTKHELEVIRDAVDQFIADLSATSFDMHRGSSDSRILSPAVTTHLGAAMPRLHRRMLHINTGKVCVIAARTRSLARKQNSTT